MTINVYAEGEGYITFLLLKSLSGDGTLDVCFRYVDRLMFKPAEKNLLLIPQINHTEREILKNHPLKDKLVVISENCEGLEGCTEPRRGPFFFGALEEVASILRLEPLKELLKHTSPEEPEEDQSFEILLEKLRFYIPLLVGKRESVIYGWKYFLATAKIPSITYVYPRDGGLIFKPFENLLIYDKLVPVLLGKLQREISDTYKIKGFVPLEVRIDGKNNLDSEVKLITYAAALAKKLKRE